MDNIPGASKFRISKVPFGSHSSNQPPRSKEKRAPTACDFCHRRKKRCDLLYPSCSACMRAKVPCTVSGREQKIPLPRDYADRLQARIDWLEQVVLKATGVDTAGLQTGSSLESQEQWHAIPSLVAGLPQDRMTGENTPTGNDLNETQNPSGLLDVGAVLSDKLENRRPVAVPSALGEVIWLDSFDEAKRLASNYFQSMGYQYPFLYHKQFMDDMGRLYDGEAVTRERHFFYHITMAISLLIKPAEGWSSDTFYQACYSSLPSILHNEDIVALRALLSLALYALFCPSGPSVWHILGVAARLATALGLHKMPSSSRSSLVTFQRRELEKRAFWSLYALDRLIAVTLGRPLALADEDITTELPDEFDDDWNRRTGTCAMSIPVHVIKLRRIFSNIYITLYRPPSSTKPTSDVPIEQTISTFRASLDTWRNSAPLLPSALHYSTNYFDYLYYTTLILLYRPSPQYPTPRGPAIVACGDSSIQVIRNYYDSYLVGEIKWIWITLCQIYAAGLTLLWCVQQNGAGSSTGDGDPRPWRIELRTVRYGVDAVGVLLEQFRARRKEVGRLASAFEIQKGVVMDGLLRAEGQRAGEGAGEDSENATPEALVRDREMGEIWDSLVDWFGGDLSDVYAL